jgi:hypothetical protein
MLHSFFSKNTFMICIYFAGDMSLKWSGGATVDGKVDLFEYVIGDIVRVSSASEASTN